MQESVYDINARWRNIMELADDEKVSDADIQKAIAEVEADMVTKCKSVIAYIKSVETLENGYAEEIKRLKARKKACQNARERLKMAYLNILVEQGKKYVDTPLGRLSVRNSPGKLIVDKPDEVPAEFQKLTYSIDYEKLKKAIKDGREISCAHIESGKTLAII